MTKMLKLYYIVKNRVVYYTLREEKGMSLFRLLNANGKEL